MCHKDIKPGNLLIIHPKDGAGIKLKIADLGLSQRKGGSPMFISPEGVTEPIPWYSDIYSLGITFMFAALGNNKSFIRALYRNCLITNQ